MSYKQLRARMSIPRPQNLLAESNLTHFSLRILFNVLFNYFWIAIRIFGATVFPPTVSTVADIVLGRSDSGTADGASTMSGLLRPEVGTDSIMLAPVVVDLAFFAAGL
ncbi:hypothetical protein M378DRAFT_18238 [Amanita muscaria Koide BX008]|uniref:Uncharacterized protein n=1 Tax=Amanita muscaria (strain Koide BX008) TaxID=946122 RepID=A0A0C2W1X4_AMAMK|nr:hypothetical protein M378DRAFT_18238 [Amanita muscaria Koide BX008]